MVRYCGYLLGNDWLLQRAVELGLGAPQTHAEYLETILVTARNVRHNSGVYPYTRFRHVKTSRGKAFWCIVFASDDPHEGLPTSTPPEERYKASKELLQRTGPPRWYQGS